MTVGDPCCKKFRLIEYLAIPRLPVKLELCLPKSSLFVIRAKSRSCTTRLRRCSLSQIRHLEAYRFGKTMISASWRFSSSINKSNTLNRSYPWFRGVTLA